MIFTLNMWSVFLLENLVLYVLKSLMNPCFWLILVHALAAFCKQKGTVELLCIMFQVFWRIWAGNRLKNLSLFGALKHCACSHTVQTSLIILCPVTNLIFIFNFRFWVYCSFKENCYTALPWESYLCTGCVTRICSNLRILLLKGYWLVSIGTFLLLHHFFIIMII